MPKKVFISYRRDDTKWAAREVHKSLAKELTSENVFRDVDSITPGRDFVDALDSWVDQCDVMLVLIGPGWLDATDDNSQQRRLDNPSDFVRMEVRKGLVRQIPVVPVLLDGARFPTPDELPDDLKQLVRRQAEFIEIRTVEHDVSRLVDRLGLGDIYTEPVVPAPQDQIIAEQQSVEPASTDPLLERIYVDARHIFGAPNASMLPGAGKTEWFRDEAMNFQWNRRDQIRCPEMVVIPAGKFTMGSSETEHGREKSHNDEGPQHEVTFAQPFAVARFAVTYREFGVFIKDTGHKMHRCEMYYDENQEINYRTRRFWSKPGWRDPGFEQGGNHPVVCVNAYDAQAYALWLSAITGKNYRLLSEAEHEYVIRAGTATLYWWGDHINPSMANYNAKFPHREGDTPGECRGGTVPVDMFAPNPWGLYNVHGNVSEWCQDFFHQDYNAAPTDGSAWIEGGNSAVHVSRGGCWWFGPARVRSADRGSCSSYLRNNGDGIRVARDLSLNM